MAESGCKAAFPESELRRILDDKLLALFVLLSSILLLLPAILLS